MPDLMPDVMPDVMADVSVVSDVYWIDRSDTSGITSGTLSARYAYTHFFYKQLHFRKSVVCNFLAKPKLGQKIV